MKTRTEILIEGCETIIGMEICGYIFNNSNRFFYCPVCITRMREALLQKEEFLNTLNQWENNYLKNGAKSIWNESDFSEYQKRLISDIKMLKEALT